MEVAGGSRDAQVVYASMEVERCDSRIGAVPDAARKTNHRCEATEKHLIHEVAWYASFMRFSIEVLPKR